MNIIIKNSILFSLKTSLFVFNKMLNEDDFYYILTKNDKMYYYSKLSGNKIAKKDIPIDLLPKIKIKDNKEEKMKESVDLLLKRDLIKTKIAALQDELKIVNDNLYNKGVYNKEDEDYARNFLKQQEDILYKRKMYVFTNNPDPNIKCNIKFDDKPNDNKTKQYFNTPPTNNIHKPNFSPLNKDNTRPCKSRSNYPAGILEKYNIKTKEEWRDWLRDNHVDKGGDNDICAYVIAAGKDKGW